MEHNYLTLIEHFHESLYLIFITMRDNYYCPFVDEEAQMSTNLPEVRKPGSDSFGFKPVSLALEPMLTVVL